VDESKRLMVMVIEQVGEARRVYEEFISREQKEHEAMEREIQRIRNLLAGMNELRAILKKLQELWEKRRAVNGSGAAIMATTIAISAGDVAVASAGAGTWLTLLTAAQRINVEIRTQVKRAETLYDENLRDQSMNNIITEIREYSPRGLFWERKYRVPA
jgi:coenzyme F420-reducing hydrogenase alpha subunit